MQEEVAKYNKRWADLYGDEAAGMAENYTTLWLEEARASGITFENLKHEDMKEELKTVPELTAQLESTPLSQPCRPPRSQAPTASTRNTLASNVAASKA